MSHPETAQQAARIAGRAAEWPPRLMPRSQGRGAAARRLRGRM